MKIALIQDSLLVCAGSERVFKCIIEEFPDADIFTLAYNRESTIEMFKLIEKAQVAEQKEIEDLAKDIDAHQKLANEVIHEEITVITMDIAFLNIIYINMFV